MFFNFVENRITPSEEHATRVRKLHRRLPADHEPVINMGFNGLRSIATERAPARIMGTRCPVLMLINFKCISKITARGGAAGTCRTSMWVIGGWLAIYKPARVEKKQDGCPLVAWRGERRGGLKRSARADTLTLIRVSEYGFMLWLNKMRQRHFINNMRRFILWRRKILSLHDRTITLSYK